MSLGNVIDDVKYQMLQEMDYKIEYCNQKCLYDLCSKFI